MCYIVFVAKCESIKRQELNEIAFLPFSFSILIV